MNIAFLQVINAKPEDRRGLFLATANRLGTTLQNIEKDFWACWILDIIFNERASDDPRVLFKGGTSLSKGYSLISRFSEDLDITFFRQDLGLTMDIEELKKISRKQQGKQLDRIKEASQTYIHGVFKNSLREKIKRALPSSDLDIEKFVVSDEDDTQKQTLLIHYPTVITEKDDYIKSTIKIEAGAKSALDPHQLITIQPYIAPELSVLNLSVPNIAVIDAERTFWDKVMILHGIRSWYDARKELRQNGHRISRHYYDVYQLMRSPVSQQALRNIDLAIDCAQHAQLFFNSAALNLEKAKHGSFTLIPTPEMRHTLHRDYNAMASMIFGERPTFDNILESISNLEKIINQYG